MNTENQSATQVDNVESPCETEYGMEYICTVLERQRVDINIEEVRSMYDRAVEANSSPSVGLYGDAIKRAATVAILRRLAPGWFNE